MIDKRTLEVILSEQKEEAYIKLRKNFIPREEEKLINLDSELAQIVMGVRRSGKSTLCFNVLKNSNVKFGYVNFDDERLLEGKVEDLNNILEVLYKIYGDFNCLFLDEAQNIEGWHLFVNRLLRRGLKLLITGSNAKLLSHELSTYLTGRYECIELFPFSFKEYCLFHEVDIESPTTLKEAYRREVFDNYMKRGGFPEIVKGANPKRYIENLTKNILQRDIRQRYKLRYFISFERLAYHLLNIVPTITSYNELSKELGIKVIQTIKNYTGYLVQAYLLQDLKKFSFKSKKRLTEEKLYAVDVALMDQRKDALKGENLGWRLETIIFIELKRRSQIKGFDIYYYKKNTRAKEVDFVVVDGNKIVALYQVAYDITNDKTNKREVNALVEISRQTGCDELYLITDFERYSIEKEGKTIKVLPAYEWLLSPHE